MAHVSWIAGGKGNWTDPENWEGGIVPTASDTAYVSGSGSMVTVDTPIEVGAIDAKGGHIKFSQAGQCDVSGDVTADANIALGDTNMTIGGRLSVGDKGMFELFPDEQDTSVSVGSIDMSARSSRYQSAALNVIGFNDHEAEIDVRGPASFGTAGVVRGQVLVSRNALIAFSGTSQIETIAAGAKLTLITPDAFVADAADTTSNSALVGLKSIYGELDLSSGASVSVDGRLTNDGVISAGSAASEGTRLSIAGKLVNRGTLWISDGGGGDPTTISMQSIDNTGGFINIIGAGSGSSIIVNGPASFGAAGAIEGVVYLQENCVFEFSGTRQITTIDTDATLFLNGSNAFLADAGIGVDSSTALTGLKTIRGSLQLAGGAEVTTSGPLTIAEGGNAEFDGGLKVGGTVTNDGLISVGTNDFDHDLLGDGRANFERGASVEFDGAVGHQIFHLQTDDTLELSDPGDFHASVHNFTRDDAYLFDAFDSSTTFNFVERASQKGGILTVSDGSMEAHFYMRGVYDNSDFALTAMQGGGVKISSTR